MASNFWTSTHYKELKDPEEVNVVHPLDAQRGISVEDFRLIKLHMSNYISKLAQHIKIRQSTFMIQSCCNCSNLYASCLHKKEFDGI